MLTAVPVNTEGAFSTGTPAPFSSFTRADLLHRCFQLRHVAKDGKRFLVNRYVRPERITPLTIVLNAQSDFKSIISS